MEIDILSTSRGIKYINIFFERLARLSESDVLNLEALFNEKLLLSKSVNFSSVWQIASNHLQINQM